MRILSISFVGLNFGAQRNFVLDVFGIITVPSKYSIASLFYSQIEVIATGGEILTDDNVIYLTDNMKTAYYYSVRSPYYFYDLICNDDLVKYKDAYLKKDYKKCLQDLGKDNVAFDIIFIDLFMCIKSL